MFTIILSAILCVLIIYAYTYFEKKEAKTKTKLLDRLRKNILTKGITLTKHTITEHGIIGIDAPNKKLVIFQNDTISIIAFHDIIDVELIKNGEILFKKSTLNTLGRAAMGGVLLGGIGALAGGLSGSTKTKEVIKKIEMKVLTKNLSIPSYRFLFFEGGSDADSQLERLLSEAENWKDTVSVIIDDKLNNQ